MGPGPGAGLRVTAQSTHQRRRPGWLSRLLGRLHAAACSSRRGRRSAFVRELALLDLEPDLKLDRNPADH